MKAALAAVAAATVAIAAILLRARRRRLRAKKIAYINTEDAPKWHDQLEVFAAALQLLPEAFEKFDAFADQFPSAAALQRGEYSGVLITGSHFSAVDPTLPWLTGLFASIRAAAAAPDVRVLGCCFGAQAVAVALGGAVGANPDGRFCYGVEEIALDGPRAARLLPEALPPTLRLLESHGEQVTRLPPTAELLGSSAGTPHEIFVAGEHGTVLCVQAHPEFTPELMGARIAPALRDKGRLSAAELEERAAAMRQRPLHSERVCSVYRAFLMGEMPRL